MTATSDIKLAFVGAGRMALALARGIANSPELATVAVSYLDPNANAAQSFAEMHPAAVRQASLKALCGESNVILLAVKPQIMPNVLSDLASVVEKRHLIISVAAGISLKTMAESLRTNRLIRVMPNTPCLIGEGISAIACGPETDESDRTLVTRLFQATGHTVDVAEYQMDAVTGLSGSGPAYVFSFIEALVDGGVLSGLPRDIATKLAMQTVHGATRLIAESGKLPAELRGEVTSPGGTTIAGLAVLERNGFRGTIMDAVAAATRRAAELSG